MENEHLIRVVQVCQHYQVDYAFIESLGESGLIEILELNEERYLYDEQIRTLEAIISWHHELDINLEGIEAIFNLLQRVDDLQKELNSVKNRLRLYEPE